MDAAAAVWIHWLELFLVSLLLLLLLWVLWSLGLLVVPLETTCMQRGPFFLLLWMASQINAGSIIAPFFTCSINKRDGNLSALG